MVLDAEVPDPPSLRGPQSRGEYEAIDMTDQEPTDDYRREELEGVLRDGAWQDAFEEWAEHTHLTDAEFEGAVELGLIERFDLYWDPATDDVGYRAPTLNGEEREAFDDPDGVDAELDSLGRVVSETLENDYLLRDENDFGFFADDYTGEEPPEER
jgi:hypothetical protein